MGLFGDLDVAAAEDNPFAIPDNTYHCFVSDVKMQPGKPNKETGFIKMNMIITYKIESDDKHNGKTFTEYKWVPNPKMVSPEPDKDAQATSFLKQRLNSFGIPSDKHNKVEAADLVGIELNVRVQTNEGGFVQVKRVDKVEAAPVGKFK